MLQGCFRTNAAGFQTEKLRGRDEETGITNKPRISLSISKNVLLRSRVIAHHLLSRFQNQSPRYRTYTHIL